MRLVVGLVLPFMVLVVSPAYAGKLDSTRLGYTQKPIIQPGPLPGTSVIRSVIRSVDLSGGDKPGRIYGECFTLVGSVDFDRDFDKSPLEKQEILGFSCTSDMGR